MQLSLAATNILGWYTSLYSVRRLVSEASNAQGVKNIQDAIPVT
jgi:hypothetical protein